MSVLTNLLSKIAKDKGDDIAVDALSSNELRNRAMNAIVDNIQGGKLNNTANAVLDNVPILTRSEGVSNMGVMIQRGNTPKYDNVAVGSINSVPLFFWRGQPSKGTHYRPRYCQHRSRSVCKHGHGLAAIQLYSQSCWCDTSRRPA